ncbi:porin [Pectobacterium sp. B1J-3]|uniref:porin n=1 Tax=Pectobacterium sp. B1J-3 TaxID=3385371 RepID=UPI0039068F13
MMKRNILAVVIPALLVAGAANAAEVYNKDGNKLDLYGKLNGLHYFSDGGDDGDKTYARLGFKGETQINSELTGFGRFEYEFSGNKAESDGANGKTRLAFAGLKFGDAGSFDYGRNYGVVYDALAWTDVLPEFGGDSAYTDGFMTQRTSGVATYRNSDFFGLVDGLNFALQYQGKNDSNSINKREMKKSNGDGWGLSASYESDIGLGFAAAYSASDRTDSQQADGLGQKAEAWATTAKYEANNVYLATTYGEYRNLSYVDETYAGFVDKTKFFEAVAQYNFDFGLTPSLAYVQSKGKLSSNGVSENDYLTKYVSVGATYAFNKNMSTYVDYQINLIKDDNVYGINDDDTVAVGLTYQF